MSELTLADRVWITDGHVRTHAPGLRFDLGGFAKGLAAAEAVARVRALGVRAGIVNLGGDLCAWGRPGERPWRIAIRHPRDSSPMAELELEAAVCAFTSGDYERYFEHEGERFHHILDPQF